MEAEEQKRVNEQITSRLYRVYITAHEMLRDRGYVVPPQLLSMSLDDFKTKFGVPVRCDGHSCLSVLQHESQAGRAH